MRTFPMLLKRESWEHPALWMVPAVLAVLIVLGMLYGLALVWHHQPDVREVGIELSKLAGLDASDRRAFLSSGLIAMATPFNFFLIGMIFFYALDSLYADRRDRSILFWKSMPVSDIETVLSKLAVATLGAPALSLLVVAVFHIAAMLLASVVAIWSGTEGWLYAWDPLVFLRAWATLAWLAVAQSLVILPAIAWVMLASAWARKAPFLWAVGTPLAIVIVEQVAYNNSYLIDWIADRLERAPHLVMDFGVTSTRIELEHGGSFDVGPAFAVNFELLWSGLLWQGMVISAVFVTAAIWLRRYRADAE